MSYAALPVLRTPRLTLRPLEASDADALVAGVDNYDVSRWLSVVPYPYGIEDAQEFLKHVFASAALIWGICDEAGLIGVVGVEDEFGYWLARPAWRRGYGFEAARAVVEHWFSDPARGDLASGFFTENERSGAVLRALGFVKTGEAMRRARSLSQEVHATKMLLTRARWEARRGFELFTPRLTLRPMTGADAPALAAMAVPEVARNLSTIRVGMTIGEASEYIVKSRFAGLPGFRIGIEKDGALVGVLAFGGTPPEIGFFLEPAHWGGGVMTEALSAFLPELFDRFPVNRIAAERFADNSASGAVLAKLGFVETGRDTGTSLARLEPAPVITYAVTRETLKVPL